MTGSGSSQAGSDQRASILSRARAAVSESGATTPTNDPSRTTVTPATALAAVVSALTSSAPCDGGRSTAPCRMPGRRRSAGNCLVPVTAVAEPSAAPARPAG